MVFIRIFLEFKSDNRLRKTMTGEYENFNNKEEQGNGSNWCHDHCPAYTRQDCISLFVVTLLSAGLAVMVLGYMVPRDYTFNPSLPAREMEQIEIFYARLSYRLDICIVTGMGMITLAGVIVTSLTVYSIYSKPNDKVYRPNDRQDLNLLDGECAQITSYGSGRTENEK